jgi:arginase family enzyme
MLSRFLHPINLSELLDRTALHANQWGLKVDFYQGGQIDWSRYKIAVLGVKDARASIYNGGAQHAPDELRREFYRLYYNASGSRIIDMGNIQVSENLEDTYYNLAETILYLRRHDILCIILGGSHELTYAQYLGYQELYEMVNVVVVDERLDMKKATRPALSSESYLMPIFMHRPNYLYNYAHLAYQSYFCDQEELESLESMNFDAYRLGTIRNDISETEPVLRTADILSIDVSCIKQADAPGNAFPSPNGFNGEELVQIFRYAGYSDRLSSIGIYELNPECDDRNATAKLMAQCLWYFIEGFENRKVEIPNAQDNEFLKFTVEFEDVDHQLVFWKSKRSDRWWMELPFSGAKKNQLIPCSYGDYQKACKEELPDRWMKAYNKLF